MEMSRPSATCVTEPGNITRFLTGTISSTSSGKAVERTSGVDWGSWFSSYMLVPAIGIADLSWGGRGRFKPGLLRSCEPCAEVVVIERTFRIDRNRCGLFLPIHSLVMRQLALGDLLRGAR